MVIWVHGLPGEASSRDQNYFIYDGTWLTRGQGGAPLPLSWPKSAPHFSQFTPYYFFHNNQVSSL